GQRDASFDLPALQKTTSISKAYSSHLPAENRCDDQGLLAWLLHSVGKSKETAVLDYRLFWRRLCLSWRRRSLGLGRRGSWSGQVFAFHRINQLTIRSSTDRSTAIRPRNRRFRCRLGLGPARQHRGKR